MVLPRAERLGTRPRPARLPRALKTFPATLEILEQLPFLAGAAMDRFGPPDFPASLFAVAALYTLFAAWRQATRGRRTGEMPATGRQIAFGTGSGL